METAIGYKTADMEIGTNFRIGFRLALPTLPQLGISIYKCLLTSVNGDKDRTRISFNASNAVMLLTLPFNIA